MSSSKKHKRFDSLMNEQFTKKDTPKNFDISNAMEKVLQVDRKALKKKKCKTQGEESI